MLDVPFSLVKLEISKFQEIQAKLRDFSIQLASTFCSSSIKFRFYGKKLFFIRCIIVKFHSKNLSISKEGIFRRNISAASEKIVKLSEEATG